MIAFQQLPAAKVGRLWVIAVTVPLGVDFIGGDGRAVGDAGRAGFGDDGDAFGCEGYGERAGSGVGVDDDGREGAVGLDMEDVDVVGDALGGDEELAVGAEGERCASGGGAGEKGGGVFDLVESATVVEVKANEAAGATAIEDVDEAVGLGNGGGLCAAGGSFAEEVQEQALWTLKTVMSPLPALTAKRSEWSWLRVREPCDSSGSVMPPLPRPWVS